MKRFYFYLMLIFSTTIFSSCDGDDEDDCCDPTNPECANYDPCYGKEATSADFAILQPYAQVGPNAGIYFEDSVTFGAAMRFVAEDTTADTYRWILGLDTIYDEVEVSSSTFNLPEGSYPVSLMVTKEADSLCFPMDDGIDEKTKFFTKINGCDAAIWGEYKGVLESSSNDSLVVQLILSSSTNSIEPCDPQSIIGAVFGLNLFNENDTSKLIGNGTTNTRYSFHIENNTSGNTGEAVLDIETGLIEISYSLEGATEKFNGIKL